MGKSTYDRIQDILMESRLQTGRMAQGNGNGAQLDPETLKAMQQTKDWDWDDLTPEQIEKFLRS